MRVRSKSEWRKTGWASFSVPGNGRGERWWVVRWDDGTETTELESELEAES